MEGFLEKLYLSIVRGVTIDPDSLKISLGKGGTLDTVIKSMFDVMMTLGIALTVAYFLLEMNRRLLFERSDFTVKSVLAPLVKLVAVIFFLKQAWNIVVTLTDCHNWIIEQAKSWGDASKLNDWQKDLASTHPFKSLGLIAKCIACLPMIIGWLVSVVCTFVYWYKSIGYKIEYLYRLGLSPVAFADVYSGNNSNAYRWFKGFFGFAMYGAAFILIPKIALGITQDTYAIFWEKSGEVVTEGMFDNPATTAATLAADSIWTFIKFIFLQMLAPIAAIGTISSVRQLTKEAFN